MPSAVEAITDELILVIKNFLYVCPCDSELHIRL